MSILLISKVDIFCIIMTDKDIIEEFKTSRYRINPNLLKYYENKEGKRFNNEIYEYIINRYNDSESFKESLCRIIFGIEIHPKCPICGNLIPFKWSLNYKIFNDCCSKHCNNIYLNKLGKINTEKSIEKANITRTNTLKEKYGVENSFQLETSKEKIKKKKIEYMNSNRYNPEEIVKKYRETNLLKYGGHPMSTEKFKEKRKLTCLETYGVKYPNQSDKVKEKIKNTCLKKYGVTNYVLSTEYKSNIKDIVNKINQSKRNNNTFNTSSEEDKVYELLSMQYEVKRNWNKDPRYPWMVDFYIPELDLFIECNFHWTHGEHQYDPNSKEDQDIIDLWKSKNTRYYDNAIETWTKRDIEKINKAKENKLRYCVFWSYNEFYTFINSTIDIPFDEDTLYNEYDYFIKCTPKLNLFPTKNSIVNYFQQYQIYKKEHELFDDFFIRYKLFRNRQKYLQLPFDELTPIKLIKGFKISGIHYGYSMFNPVLAKWFIQRYNLENKICYDPCGGWGHRLLGIAPFVKKYIYNDLSIHTLNGCKNIAKFCKLTNIDFYNEDAKTFNPNENYDFMFTCPPYYAENKNIEEYECDGFNSQEEYYDFITSLYDKFINKESCKIFALVIREDMLPVELEENIKASYCLSKTHTLYFNNKKYKEYLYIFQK